ncbi:hypothetical protein PHISCL_10587 [Aspergillus sclerotialis]|uniref:Uncharacterized protein n=1 Tax=Aspergillus sclerotialis TaxID=2070753 RepID=A0A3A2Z2I2_9EURO|nr:hypothetical protein PHISCL_10587 [Aspergillus sclerotialis]
MDEDEAGFIADLQAAHSSHIAGMLYGRQMMEPRNSTTRQRQLFRQSSQDWHHFLEFPSAREAQIQAFRVGPRGRHPWEDEADEARVQRRYDLYREDMTTAFQHMMGDASIPLRGGVPKGRHYSPSSTARVPS